MGLLEILAKAQRALNNPSEIRVAAGMWGAEEEDMDSVRAIEKHWWWAIASGAQFGWCLLSYRKGYAGDSRLMPLKAFAVASIFLGGAASASISALQASGIHKVEDLMEVGANIRTGLGIRPRVRKEEK